MSNVIPARPSAPRSSGLAPALATARSSAVLRAILWGGFSAGVLDLAAAITQSVGRGGTATRLLQAIATGILGRASYEGGAASAALGFIAHFIIAFGAAAVFVVAARRIPFLLSIIWLSGPVYGMMVWAVMKFAVLPLSAYPHGGGSTPRGMVVAVLIHVFCVGLPIAIAARVTLQEGRARS
jgi:hypothetical protein